MPVIKHLDGDSHVYVDAEVDLEMALAGRRQRRNAKSSPCNAAESLLVHARRASGLPASHRRHIFAAKPRIQMRCDECTLAAFVGDAGVLGGSRRCRGFIGKISRRSCWRPKVVDQASTRR